MSSTVNKFIIKTCDYKANLYKLIREKDEIYNNRIVIQYALQIPRVTDKYELEAFSSGCKKSSQNSLNYCECREGDKIYYINK